MYISDEYSEFLKTSADCKVDVRELVDWRDFRSGIFGRAIVFVFDDVSTVTRMAFSKFVRAVLGQCASSPTVIIVRYDLSHGDYGWSSVLGKKLGCAGEIFTISGGCISKALNILNCQDEMEIVTFLSSHVPTQGPTTKDRDEKDEENPQQSEEPKRK